MLHEVEVPRGLGDTRGFLQRQEKPKGSLNSTSCFEKSTGAETNDHPFHTTRALAPGGLVHVVDQLAAHTGLMPPMQRKG